MPTEKTPEQTLDDEIATRMVNGMGVCEHDLMKNKGKLYDLVSEIKQAVRKHDWQRIEYLDAYDAIDGNENGVGDAVLLKELKPLFVEGE